MKICAFGIQGLVLGKHNVKDPRLDQAHELVEADKKVYAQVDVVGEKELVDAQVILTTQEAFPDLLLKDLEFIETRLGRNPPENEKAVRTAGLTADELSAIAAHGFFTNKPVVIAKSEQPDALILRAFKESGYICFLTVGGKENRAWPIPKSHTAWEAAASIHTDLQKGFIRAEIISFEDFVAAGGETQAKRAGKQRLETKTYVMQDYDLVNFRFSK
jgi:hypothetical protein